MGAQRRRLSATLAHLAHGDVGGAPIFGAMRAAGAAAASPEAASDGAPGYAHRNYSPEEVDGYVEQLQTEGWVVLPNAVEPELVAALIGASDRLMAAEGDGDVGRMLGNQALNSYAVGKDPVYWELLANANFLAVARGFLGFDFLLSSSQTRNVHPGCSEQGFHTVSAQRPWPISSQIPDALMRRMTACTATRESCASSSPGRSASSSPSSPASR